MKGFQDMTPQELEADLARSLLRAEAIAKKLSEGSETAELTKGYDRIRAQCEEAIGWLETA